MKKVVVLFTLVALMVLSLSYSALGAGQAYFDYIANGEWETGDLSGIILGLDYKANSIKFGIDYLSGEIEDGVSDYTQMILKGGYGINENVFVTMSMIDNTVENDFAELSADGIILGIDLAFDLSDQASFEGAFGFSLSGDGEGYLANYGRASGDVDFTILKLKLIFNVSNNIGLALGYNDISCDLEGSNSIDINYMTLGATYKF